MTHVLQVITQFYLSPNTSSICLIAFSGTLQLYCKFRYSYKMLSVVVCRLSVTRVYCDKKAEARIMQFHLNVAQCLSSLSVKFDSEIRKGSP